MSHESEGLRVSDPVEPLSWREVWVRALTQPAVATFERLLQDPEATVRRAYTWMAVTAAIAYLVSWLLNASLGGLGLAGLCGAVVAPVGAVLGLAISAGLTHLVARALGGTGTYPELAYAYATYQAPLALISGVLSSLPYVGYLSYAIGLYVLVLNVLAVQAVHRFSRGKAIVCALVMPIVLGLIVACIVMGVLLLIGPAIGDVYDTILDEMLTPVP